MKIIHCADLHLDSVMTTHLSKQKAKIRQAELLHTFMRMIAMAEKWQVSAIIIAGDLYDKNHISASARQTVIDAVLRHPDIDFFYLRGNHDNESLMEGWDIPENLKLFRDQFVSYPVKNSNVVVTGIELTRDNQERLYDEIRLPEDRFNILVMHGQIAEGRGKKEGDRIRLDLLKNKGIDYLALGHIHEYRQSRLDGRGIYCYPGCLEGRGFDECGEHGFVLLDISQREWRYSIRFVPIAGRNCYIVEVDISDCMTTVQIADRIGNCLDGLSYDEKDLIKVVLKGQVEMECEKNLPLLNKMFEKSYFVLKIEDHSEYVVFYDEYQYDESLKGEFVRTVMGEPGLSEEEKAEILRYGFSFLMNRSDCL